MASHSLRMPSLHGFPIAGWLRCGLGGTPPIFLFSHLHLYLLGDHG